MMLREQIEMEKDGFKKQNALFNNEIRCESKSCASETEHAPKMQCDKSDSDDSNVDDAWIQPKKFVPMTYFFKKCKNEGETEKVNNKHSMLIDEYENDEDKDYEMKHCKTKTEVSCSAGKTKDDNEKTKVIKSDGVDNEIEEACEKECVKCKTLQENSDLTEVLCEMLVTKLKQDLFGLTVKSDEVDYDSVEKAHEEIDNHGKKKMHIIEKMKSTHRRKC